MSKVVILIEMDGMTHKEYDAILKEMKAQGKLANAHRPSHVAFERDGKWCVVDVWDSAEDLNDFVSTTLGPIFGKLGITAPQPHVYPVHNYMGKEVEELISA